MVFGNIDIIVETFSDSVGKPHITSVAMVTLGSLRGWCGGCYSDFVGTVVAIVA